MLTTRGSKRDKSAFFNTDLMFDVMDGERQVGTFVFDKKVYKSAIIVDGGTYVAERVRDQPDDNNLRALMRLVTGAEKPPANPWALKDPGGNTLALAEQVKTSFAISRGAESYVFRKVKRPYHLFRQGSEQSLGSVGQAGFFTRTLHMDLPTEFEPAFQVFLLSMVLTVSMQQLDSST
jgi:hypothetical protein